MDGLYATMTVQNPTWTMPRKPIRFWATKYKTAFTEDRRCSLSMATWRSTASFAPPEGRAQPEYRQLIKAMDTMEIPRDIFGGAVQKFGPQKRLGSNLSRLSQLHDGRWTIVSNYITDEFAGCAMLGAPKTPPVCAGRVLYAFCY